MKTVAYPAIVKKDYVNFGDVARKELGQQCQYACRYTGIDAKGDGVHNPEVWGKLDYPDLGESLRFHGNTNLYHELMIHCDDVKTFVKRYWLYRETGSVF